MLCFASVNAGYAKARAANHSTEPDIFHDKLRTNLTCQPNTKTESQVLSRGLMEPDLTYAQSKHALPSAWHWYGEYLADRN